MGTNLDKRLRLIENKIQSHLELSEQYTKLQKTICLSGGYLNSYAQRVASLEDHQNKSILLSIESINLPSGFYVAHPYYELTCLGQNLQCEEFLGVNIASGLYRQYFIELLEAMEKKLFILPQPRVKEPSSLNIPATLLAQLWISIKPYRERFLTIWDKRSGNTTNHSGILISGRSINHEIDGCIVISNRLTIGSQIANNLSWQLIVAAFCLALNKYCLLLDFIETVEVKGW